MTTQRIGDVQVSTLDQDKQRRLESQTFDRVYTYKASGKDTEQPRLGRLIESARKGETVGVYSMDRLARNLDGLRSVVQGMTAKGASSSSRKVWCSRGRTRRWRP